MPYTLPELPYSLDALEPYISQRSLDIHYNQHHRTYCVKLNEALKDHPELSGKDPEWLVDHLEEIPEDIRTKVRNFGGGYVNHIMFWHCMTPRKDMKMPKPLQDAIEERWGSVESFKEAFMEAASSLFGSGWAWLVQMPDGTLDLVQTKDQDRPNRRMKILMGMDVWEHGYAHQYESQRAQYLTAAWHIINWEFVASQMRHD